MKVLAATPVAVLAAYVMDEVIFAGAYRPLVIRMATTVCAAFGFC